MLTILAIVLIPALLFLGFFLTFFFRFRGIYRAQGELHRQGDYQGQLTAIEGLRVRGSEPKYYLLFRGMALYQLGRLPEAEQALRRGVAAQTKPWIKARCRDQLGRVLMAQSRWDEAADCFEQCKADCPKECTAAGLSMAELRLRRGQQPLATQAEVALQESRQAELDERARKPGNGKAAMEIHEVTLARAIAVQAWAMARIGGAVPPIEAAIQEAFALCGQRAKPLLTKCITSPAVLTGTSATPARATATYTPPSRPILSETTAGSPQPR